MKENCKKQQKKKQTKVERSKGTEAIVKGWELNGFVVHYKLGFLQLICKV